MDFSQIFNTRPEVGGSVRQAHLDSDPAWATLPVAQLRDAQIRALLDVDGYSLYGREAEIRLAAQNGALLWTSERLTTTDTSRIDEAPA